MKQVLLKTLIGTLAFFIFLVFAYGVILTYSFLDTRVGYGSGVLFITSPLWLPVAYLGGDTILSNKDKILSFFRRKK